MKLYEFNQLGYNAIPDMTEEEKIKVLDKIANFIYKNDGDYFMLLNNDLHYYTVFTWKDDNIPYKMANEILNIANELGVIKAIELNDNNAIEFWIKHNDECHAYFLFNYDKGVVLV